MDRNTEASILELATTRRLIAALTLSAAVVGCKGDPDVDHDTHATETGDDALDLRREVEARLGLVPSSE